ncbi:MAG: ATP-dependent helicase [Thermotaleaceae bacterium]
MIFREDQLPIMAYRDGTMAVPAVPGAGKTFIITNLASDILTQERHKPGKVLIVTYMVSAANNFKNRIEKLLKEKSMVHRGDYEVMTIHSLALRILKESPDILGLNEGFEILEDRKRISFLQQASQQWLKMQGEDTLRGFLQKDNSKALEEWKKEFQGVVGNLISLLKMKDIDPKAFGTLTAAASDPLLQALAEIYKGYDKALRLEGMIDYDDLLNLSYKMLKQDSSMRGRYQSRYTYIFEDECQDSNLLQGKLLALLSQKHGNLIRVGDVNQSITGTFSASNPSFFKEFCHQAQACHRMDMANRSAVEILELANFLIEDVQRNHPEIPCREALVDQRIRPVPQGPWGQNPSVEEYPIYSYVEKNWDGEVRKTLAFLKKFRLKYPEKTVAILVPVNFQIEPLSIALNKAEIPHEVLANTAGRRMKSVKILGRALQYVGAPHHRDTLEQLLSALLGEPQEEVLKNLIQWTKAYGLEVLLYEQEELDIEKLREKPSKEAFELVKAQLNRIKRLLELPQSSPEELLLQIPDLFEFSWEEKAMTAVAAPFVKGLGQREPQLTYGELGAIFVQEGSKLFKTAAETIYEGKDYEAGTGSVTVSTYHKAKGLEWDCVFLMGLTQYHFPSSLYHKSRSESWYLKDDYKNPTAVGKAAINRLLGLGEFEDPIVKAKIEEINEKIRLLYVGITRAREFLVLLTHQQHEEKSKGEEISYYFQRLQAHIYKQRSKSL